MKKILLLLVCVSMSAWTMKKEDWDKALKKTLEWAKRYEKANNEAKLVMAIESNNIREVKRLFDQGINFNKIINNQYTPLTLAILENKPGVVSFLIAHKANVDLKDGEGLAPIFRAIQSANIHSIESPEMLKILIKNGAKINVKNKNGYPPLIEAIQSKNRNFVKLLLKAGAEVNQDAFLFARIQGIQEILSLLQEYQ